MLTGVAAAEERGRVFIPVSGRYASLGATPPATATGASTPVATATATRTATVAATSVSSPTRTRTPSPTASPSPSATRTATATATASRTATPTAGSTATATPGFYGATDRFGRADDAVTLGRADSGQAWESDGSRWGVCGGRACVVEPAPGSPANYARLETNLADLRAAVTIARSVSASAAQAALVLRVAPDWATYMLYVGLDATGVVDVWELVGGSWSQVSTTATAYTAGADRRLEARVDRTRLDVYVDGRPVVAGITVQTPPSGATRAGLFADTSDPAATWPRFDDYAVERWP